MDAAALIHQDDTATRARELRRFLRARRARLSPTDVGLPVEKRRRAPGLRREDVAELAEISVSWYGQFEVGRASHVSARTVETIGRVLRLDATEMAYLLRLCGLTAPPERAVPQTITLDAVQHVLHAFTGGPAHVIDRNYNVIALNDIARAVFTVEPGDNLLRRLFLTGDGLAVFPDFERIAARFVAGARVRYPEKAGDPEFESIIADVRSHSEAFARLWDAGDLGSSFGQPVRVRPEGSDVITLTWLVFPLPDSAEHMLILSPAADPTSRARIELLMKR